MSTPAGMTPMNPGQSGESVMQPASTRGAVDLSTLATPGGGTAAPAESSGGASWAQRIRQADFEQVVQLSATAPLVVSLGAAAAPASVQLDQVLTSVVNRYAGRLALVLVDAQAEPAVAQAFRVQQIPAVVALIHGQPIPLFQGNATEEQIASLFDELIQLGVQNGVTGTLPPFASNEEAEPELPPLHQRALDAINAGDYTAAEAAYREALAEKPNDHDAAIGLANVGLLRRTSTMDLQAVRTAGAEHPDELQAQLDVADMDVLGGHVEDAFRRLIAFIGRNTGDEREAARARLVEYFGIVGANDDRVKAARQRLARVLF